MIRLTATTVISQPDYNIRVIFDNGEERIFDVKPYIKGSWYGMLRDETYFGRVSTDGDTVVWLEGQDICPDELYECSKAVK
jgi:hypothetical protein